MQEPRHLRVFLSSPGDAAAERAIARRILSTLPYDPFLRGRITIEIVAEGKLGTNHDYGWDLSPTHIQHGLANKRRERPHRLLASRLIGAVRRHSSMSASLTIRVLGPADASVLDCVAPGVFDNAIDPRWAAEFLADPRHHMVVALLGEQVVGMASALHYVHPDKPPEFWVNEVGVAPSHQGRGVGRKLLQALFAHGRALGCREAWLGTEETNVAARRLYAAVGGEEEPMVYVTFRLASDA